MARVKIDEKTIEKILGRGVEEVIAKGHLEAALRSGKKLRVKFGIDPTAPDLHLGHAVPLRKLRQFQDLGHKAVLIIGDFTAMIGDPSGRVGARPPLTKERVKENMKRYLRQAGKIINVKNAEIHYNSKWLGKKQTIIELSRAATVQQVLHREDFKKRIAEGGDVTLLEVLYPLLQGYDSVMVKADAEIGGTDQKFNLLMGRQIQRYFGMAEQDILMVPLLEGTDGVRKMSKSYDNYIGLDVVPSEMFGKIMSIPDQLIDKYYVFLTDKERKIANPYPAKIELAETLVGMYYGTRAATEANREFARVFRKHGAPSETLIFKLPATPLNVLDLLVRLRMVVSKSQAKQLVEQGAVEINGQACGDFRAKITPKSGMLIKVGKRRFAKIA